MRADVRTEATAHRRIGGVEDCEIQGAVIQCHRPGDNVGTAGLQEVLGVVQVAQTVYGESAHYFTGVERLNVVDEVLQDVL